MKFFFSPHYWILFSFAIASLADGRALTHGPVVGGVTDTNAQIFVRTDGTARVQVRYSTDPTLTTYSTSDQFTTDGSSDFTEIIPLNNLTAETNYYLDVTVN